MLGAALLLAGACADEEPRDDPALPPLGEIGFSGFCYLTDEYPYGDLASFRTEPTPDDVDIREAAFRHQFEHNASGLQSSASAYCLEVEDRADPPLELLDRFEGHTPPVRPGSACARDDYNGVIDIVTGERALIFRVDAIRRLETDRAWVVGGYFEAGLSATGNTFDVIRTNGVWVVRCEQMHWIA
jgi:hypothetical protein